MLCSGYSRRFTVLVWIPLLIGVLKPAAFPQTTWFKYEGNPVFTPGPTGSWDEKGVCILQVLAEDSVLRAWYSGNDGQHRRLGYATSRDGITWVRHPKPVLDLGPDGSWDWREATKGSVLHEDSLYHMWYHGYDGSLLRIGYARSNDGIRWKKYDNVNPVLGTGPAAWDAQSVGFPAVLRDPAGTYRMWYSGYAEGIRVTIGHASAPDPTSWTKFPSPVITAGSPGSWDDRMLAFPSVVFNGRLYEMWYGGSRATYTTSRIGHAISPDGIRWTKDRGNPVLVPGTPGSWDDEAAYVGDVFFDGKFYRMWYGGFDGQNERTGLAISPVGSEVTVSADRVYMTPGVDSVLVSVRVLEPAGLMFSAEFGPKDEVPVARIDLFDDGRHGDGPAGDGFFANFWVPTDERTYSVDIRLKVRGLEGQTFVLENAAVFTTIGPVALADVLLIGDTSPSPGDTVLFRLSLRNDGSSATADSTSLSLATSSMWITDLGSSSDMYGTVAPGAVASGGNTFRFFISPNCPLNTDIRFQVTVAAAGTPLWRDSFVLSVLPPWWRTTWAYGLYAVCAVALLYGIRRLENKRVRIKHQHEMNRFQAERLKELDRMKSRFFANISHEFRTPLTLIRGPVEQMLSGEFTGDPKPHYEMIVRNSRRLERLVNQLLDLSRLESGQMKLEVSETEIGEAVRGIAASFESLATQKGIRFEIATPDQPVTGWIDRDALEKILTNLLSNAFKFTPEGGEVSVSVSKDVSGPGQPAGEGVVLRVADTGIGIASGQLDRVFDRFYQVDSSKTREHEGTGIGLALTKELVELHGGKITVTSEPGHGTVFAVFLPLGTKGAERGESVRIAPASRAAPPQEPVERADSPADSWEEDRNESPTVLVVEDNADMRQYIRRLLDRTYTVLESVDGFQGIGKAQEIIPDLVISDVMMPGLDGVEMCRRLRTDVRTSHIPVILLTARAGTDYKLEGLETGADDYLVKPFDSRELLARVKNLIDQRKKLREKFGKGVSLKPREIAVTSLDEQFLNRALEVAEAHISDRSFTADAFAREMFLSRMQLHRKLKALTDRSPGEFVRAVRMKRAAQLLQTHSGTVAEIGYQVAYDHPSHFAEAFRKHFGMTPSDFAARRPPPS